MKWLGFICGALLLPVSPQAGQSNSVSLPSLTIATNIYRQVVLTKRNALEAVLRFDGGIRKVRIADLPEPWRSRWLDPTEAARLEAELAERVTDDRYAAALNDARKRYLATVENFVVVDGQLVSKKKMVTITGTVEKRFNDGVMLRRKERVSIYRGPITGRRVKIGEESVDKGYAFIRNASFVDNERFRAVPVGIKEVHGLTAHVYDCGTVPEFVMPEKPKRQGVETEKEKPRQPRPAGRDESEG